jgi:hypothetical protein
LSGAIDNAHAPAQSEDGREVEHGVPLGVRSDEQRDLASG